MDGRFEETFMDIVNFVDASFRTIPEKSGRAIAGLSMGGFHSKHISHFHPNTFDYVGVFSGAGIGPIDASSVVYQDFEGVLRRQMENGFQLYWLAMERDSFQNEGNARFLAKLDEMGFPYTYHWAYGGHTIRNWRIYLTLFVPMLFQR
jgi:enterochelin esterase family protein